MASTHNALLGALSRHAHLSELSESLNVGGNILTPTQRRALALYNLTGDYKAFTNGSIVTPGAGISGGTGTIVSSQQLRNGNVVQTRIFIDLTGLASIATDGDAIGAASGSAAAPIGQITAAAHAAPCWGRMICVETPAGGLADIDLASNTSGAIAKDGAVVSGGTQLIAADGNWAVGQQKLITAAMVADSYLYIVSGAGSGAGTYTAGRFIIELEGSTFVGT